MPLLTQEQLPRLYEMIKQGKRSPVFLLFGEEYLMKQAASNLIDLMLPGEQKTMNLSVVDGDQERVADTVENLNTFPLFASPKVVWVKNSRAFDSKVTAKELFKRARKAYSEGDREDAARLLGRMLGSLGWSLEDVRGGRLQDLSEKEWQDTLGSAKVPEQMKWIEDLVDFMADRGMDAAAGQEGGLLEQALASGFAGKNILILTCPAVDKRKSLFKLIQEKGVIVDLSLEGGSARETREIREDALIRHIQFRLQEAGKKMEGQAQALFLSRVDPDLHLVDRELDKLISYTGERTLIQTGDVDELVGLSKEEAIYEIMDAVGRKNAVRSLSLFERLLDQNIHVLAVEAVLVRKVRQLVWAKGFIMKNGDAPSQSTLNFALFQKNLYKKMDEVDRKVLGGMAPYGVFKLLQQAERFDLDELVQAMEWLQEADIKLKSGALEPQRLMESVLIKMCLGGDPR